MLLNEMFGFGAPSPEKLINQIAKLLSDMSGYLHLGHTRQGHRDKKDYHAMEAAEFSELQNQFAAGEDVTSQLQEMKQRLKKADGFW